MARTQINFANRSITLVSNEAAIDRPFSRDRSGLNAVVRGDQLHVLHVASGSPAERAGLSAGDQVVLINGEGIAASLSARRGAISHQPVGTRINLTRDDGRKFTLILEDYF